VGVASVLLVLSWVPTVLVFFAGINWDPDDYPGSYYRARIPGLRVLLIVSILIPAMSAAASLMSIRTKPRNASRIAASAIALCLALAVAWCCWLMGTDAVEEASRLAEELSN
jgi:hypothetical protein